MLADNGHHFLALGDQVYDPRVDLIETLTQFRELSCR
jgi:hypothetical protein